MSIKEKIKNKIVTGKLVGLKAYFHFFCKFICNNWLKLFIVGDKKLRVGFPLMPYFCKKCPKFNPKVKDAYIKMGRWNPYG